MDVLSAAKRLGMFSEGDLVVVAVSGGPDSVAMLHALCTRSDEFGISLHVAHLNHGIRGEQSKIDEEFVRNLAHEFGLPCTVDHVDVPALRESMRMGEEEAARELRYRFLQETATQLGAGRIAVGHTSDDRAETVLLNLIRGSGIEGLASMRPVAGNIVRPLIDAARTDVLAYIAEHALPYRVDESNADLSYTRNRIRHELIPLLEQSYNPRARQALARLAEIAEAECDLVDGLVQPAKQRTTFRSAIDAGLFLDLPLALQRRLMRELIAQAKSDLKDVEFEQIERVLDAIRSGGDFTVTLPSGVIYASRRGAAVKVTRKRERPAVRKFDYPLAIPGATQVPEVGLVMEADYEDGPQPRKTGPDEALIDESAVRGILRIRSVKPGDRIVPFGMHDSKKLQDVFVDRKVSVEERARAAVVVDDEKILWVVGHVVSEFGRVTEGTRRAVLLKADSSLRSE